MIISHSSPEKHVLINSRLGIQLVKDADTSYPQHVQLSSPRGGEAAAGGAATAVQLSHFSRNYFPCHTRANYACLSRGHLCILRRYHHAPFIIYPPHGRY